MNRSCSVKVEAGGEILTLVCEAGTSLLEVLGEAGVFTDAPCGGNGKCGKCLVRVSGDVSVPDPEEEALLNKNFAAGFRLACRARVCGDCTVCAGKAEKLEISTEGAGAEFDFDPWAVRPALGAAVDIGTTTVVVYLFDLVSGLRLATLGELNRQRSFGADVISRIKHCIEEPNAREEQTVLIHAQLRDMFSRAAAEAGRSASEITAVTVAGNTTMEHLFASLSPDRLARIPFTPESLFGESFLTDCTEELGIDPGAEVFILPAVAGYVGGDITGAALAAGMDRERGTVLLLDVGTNGEMVLCSGERLYCCATAAGPAFEGANIVCGMGGAPGAIDTARLENGKLLYTVIGGGEPAGICGSGLIDLLACMLECGAVDETGRLLPPEEAESEAAGFIDEIEGEVCFRVCGDIRITAKDVRMLQLAKAAIAAGMRTLLDSAGISAESVEKLCVAGGFGNHINPVTAGRIGLYPQELTDRSVALGNAAGTGAGAVLCSAEARRSVTALRDRMKYVELSTDPRFMTHYVEQMMF